MNQIFSPKIRYGVSIFLITVIVSLSAMNIINSINNGSNLVSVKAAQTGEWNVTFRITESSGAGNTVVIGATINSSDGQDQNDLPEPPAPPQVPFLLTWFDTSFSLPYDKLLHEYKSTSSNRLEWNLSILWMPESQNHSTTTVRILWNITQVKASGYDSFILYENNTVAADMLIKENFSYTSNGALHQFQIIAQRQSTNHTIEPSQQPVPSISIGIIFVVLVIIMVVSIIIVRRKK